MSSMRLEQAQETYRNLLEATPANPRNSDSAQHRANTASVEQIIRSLTDSGYGLADLDPVRTVRSVLGIMSTKLGTMPESLKEKLGKLYSKEDLNLQPRKDGGLARTVGDWLVINILGKRPVNPVTGAENVGSVRKAVASAIVKGH